MRFRVLCDFIGGAICIAVALPLIGIAAAQTVRRSSQNSAEIPDQVEWYRSYLAHSRQVRLPDDRTLNMYCAGKGLPTVIMEAGLSENSLTWWKVQPQIAKMTRVCVYDRAGLGFSPIGPMPRDTKAEVADLEQLLKSASVKPPYLLVGHSMAGYNLRLFASRHLKDVAGMVLIDPSVENQIPIMEKALPAIVEGDQRTLRRSKACADPNRSADIIKYCVRAAPASFPPDLAKKFTEAQGLHTSQTIYSEGQSFIDRDSEQVIAERRSFGAMPFIVLTRGKLDSDLPADQAATQAKMLMQMHDEVGKLSSIGVNRRIEGSGHYIQLEKPEAVIGAVSEILSTARHRFRG